MIVEELIITSYYISHVQNRIPISYSSKYSSGTCPPDAAIPNGEIPLPSTKAKVEACECGAPALEILLYPESWS